MQVPVLSTLVAAARIAELAVDDVVRLPGGPLDALPGGVHHIGYADSISGLITEGSAEGCRVSPGCVSTTFQTEPSRR